MSPRKAIAGRRWLVLAGLLLIVVGVSRPLFHLIRAALRDSTFPEAVPDGFIDDASRLNRTAVSRVIELPADPDSAIEAIRQAIELARSQRLPISIAGARHSMGGQTIAPGGIVLDTHALNRMSLDRDSKTLRVQSGARWSEIVPYLDERGYSVGVMQSNNVFSVGGSISVNCHGWQPNHAPIASTVRSFRLVAADGSVLNASRDQNQELFSLVLGGYGLFGVILDVELEVVPNEAYKTERYIVPMTEYARAFERKVLASRSPVGMAYGRLSVAPESFLDEAILTVFFRDSTKPPPSLFDPSLTELKRLVFRGSVGSAYGKSFRWAAEKRVGEYLLAHTFSRNQLLNEALEVTENRDPATTDILVEYFVPLEAFEAFTKEARTIIRRQHADLLNVTVRDVAADGDTYLRYADRRMLALVMLFNQPRTREGEERMKSVTRELIDAAHRAGGRYYLPYRLHARADQFRAAYPMSDEFFALKRRYDPEEIFQNGFYAEYGQER